MILCCPTKLIKCIPAGYSTFSPGDYLKRSYRQKRQRKLWFIQLLVSNLSIKTPTGQFIVFNQIGRWSKDDAWKLNSIHLSSHFLDSVSFAAISYFFLLIFQILFIFFVHNGLCDRSLVMENRMIDLEIKWSTKSNWLMSSTRESSSSRRWSMSSPFASNG